MPDPRDVPDRASALGDGKRRRFRESDVLAPLVVAISIVLGWYVVLDYERTMDRFAAVAPEASHSLGAMRLMMGLLSVGALGLAVLAVREAGRRRRAEEELRQAHAALGRRMARRTQALLSRGRALRESRWREKLAGREAEAAFADGQSEAAGAYLHGVGNALSSLELEVLRFSRDLDGAGRVAAACDALCASIEAGDAAEAGRRAAALRRALVEGAIPRLAGRARALGAIKARMLDDLERYRDAFERPGRPRPLATAVRLDEELAAILDRMPRAAGHDPVTRDIAAETVVVTRRRPFLSGLAALLRQALDAATRPVAVRLAKGTDVAAVLVVEGVPEAEAGEPGVAAFINFLNENGGQLRFEPAAKNHPSRLVVEIGDAATAVVPQRRDAPGYS